MDTEERTRLCRYIDDSRTLLRLDTTLTIIAAIAFLPGALLNQTISDRLEIAARSSADFIAGRLSASCLGFIRLDKGSPAGKLREETRRQRRVTAAINDRAASQQNLLDLRAADSSSRDKNHFRKLDGPQASTVRLHNSTGCSVVADNQHESAEIYFRLLQRSTV